MYEAYFTKRLFEALTLAEEAQSAEERSIHLRASRYYCDLLNHPEKRSAVRHKVRIDATLERSGEEPLPIVVTELSTRGARIEVGQELQTGSVVAIEIHGLAPLDACVIWQRYEQVGCRFLSELHPALLEAALEINTPAE
jgi:hypothetical protein